jgi:hypothetical protein
MIVIINENFTGGYQMATDTVQRAIEAAQRKYSPDVWLVMRPEERTAAIYEEIRRMDAEATAGAPIQHQQRKPEIRGALA